MQIPSEEWRKLSHRERRRLVNKERRRWRRRALAQKKAQELAALEEDPEYLERQCEEEKRQEVEERRCQAQSLLEEEAWLAREREAQEIFRQQREKEEKIQKEKEERERLIREEWEALQRREKEEEEKREKAKREKEERLKEALSVGERPKVVEQPWHNPLAPDNLPPPLASPSTLPANYGTEKDTQNCAFFLKTGACRFGDRCSRKHPRPSSSTTLLIPSMYSSLGLVEQMLNERDQDAGLEYDEGDLYEHFKQFYEDTLPEFSKAGKVVQFKVCCNQEPHLRGNVYVQYTSEEECLKAYQMFNGRWYAQKQLSCEFCPVQKWKNAICGLFHQKRCPKGKHCNFLHVFRNPEGAFSRADRDLSPSSPLTNSHRRRDSGSYSRRHSDTRSRRRSRERMRHRSRSRTRNRSPRFSRSRRRSRYHSRSKSRSRSRSPYYRKSSRRKHRKRHRSRESRSLSTSSSPRSLDSASNGSKSDRSLRDSSPERRSTSPTRYSDGDGDKHASRRRHSSRKKKRRKHRRRHHSSSRSPEPLDHYKHSHRKAKKHKTKKKHKRRQSKEKREADVDIPREEVQEEKGSVAVEVVHLTEEGVIDRGGHGVGEEAMEIEKMEGNTKPVPSDEVCVNDDLFVTQQGDQMTVGVSSTLAVTEQ